MTIDKASDFSPVCCCTGQADVAQIVSDQIKNLVTHTPECILSVLSGALVAIDSHLAMVREIHPHLKDLTIEEFIRLMRAGEHVQSPREAAAEQPAAVVLTENGLPIVVVGSGDLNGMFNAMREAVRQRMLDQQGGITPVLGGRRDEPS